MLAVSFFANSQQPTANSQQPFIMMWNQRYSESGYVYGTQPNDFLAEVVDRLPRGRVLCLAEGEGRNAVFLAGQGFEVVAVDASPVGLQKAERLAEEREVTIETVVADLHDYPIAPSSWEVIVSIFAHVPVPLRERLHREAVAGLKPGGAFVLEAYTEQQLQYRTGGPPTAALMMSRTSLASELAGLDFQVLQEAEREIKEGKYHHGRSAVVQVLAFKPGAE